MNEHVVLKLVQIAGYVNLAALIYGVFNLKEAGHFWPLARVAVPGIVALIVAALYHFSGSSLFQRLRSNKRRNIVQPYILAAAIAIAFAIFLLGLILFKAGRTPTA